MDELKPWDKALKEHKAAYPCPNQHDDFMGGWRRALYAKADAVRADNAELKRLLEDHDLIPSGEHAKLIVKVAELEAKLAERTAEIVAMLKEWFLSDSKGDVRYAWMTDRIKEIEEKYRGK
jgi:hypothetical protein